MKKTSFIYLSFLFITGFGLTGCNKLIEIGTPENQLVTESVFTDTVTAESAIRGMYSKLANGYLGSDPGTFTALFNGLSADEGYHYTFTFYDEFRNNALTPLVYYVTQVWNGYYNYIHTANSLLEGDSASSLPAAYKSRTIAEAKFARALCHFYLVNEFGPVPLVLTTNVAITNTLPRESVDNVYAQIEKDLKDAQAALPSTLDLYGGNKTRATSWAATALLARVYLYRGKYAEAEAAASAVIGNPGLFSIDPDVTTVFLANSQEGILQLVNALPFSWWANNIGTSSFNVTPNFVLSDGLWNSFETDDLRRTGWVRIKSYGSVDYPVPAKYVFSGGSGSVEYGQLLRMSEQYLIRAEARTQLGRFEDAADDIDVVRTRAGLSGTAANDQASLMAAIEQENRHEFFMEWGHRWLDLKRWKGIVDPSKTRADEVLSALKGDKWQSTDALYPVPQQERNVNGNLTQNPGYN